MEFEFYHELSGAVAKCEFEQELFGIFLTAEIQCKKLAQNLSVLALESMHTQSVQKWQGKQYQLMFADGEVELKHYSEAGEVDSELAREFETEIEQLDDNFSALSQTSGCGLEDFIELIEQWQDFI